MSEIARDVVNARLEALEGPPLLLVELPTEGGGLELLICDEAGQVVDTSFVPAELVDQDQVGVAVTVPRQRRS